MKNKSLYISLLLILINIVFFFRNTLISLLPEILAFFIKIVILFYPFLIAALMSYFVYSIMPRLNKDGIIAILPIFICLVSLTTIVFYLSNTHTFEKYFFRIFHNEYERAAQHVIRTAEFKRNELFVLPARYAYLSEDGEVFVAMEENNINIEFFWETKIMYYRGYLYSLTGEIIDSGYEKRLRDLKNHWFYVEGY